MEPIFFLIQPIYAYQKFVWIYQKTDTVHWLHSRVEGLCLDNNRRSEVEKSYMEMGKMEMSFFCTPQQVKKKYEGA